MSFKALPRIYDLLEMKLRVFRRSSEYLPFTAEVDLVANSSLELTEDAQDTGFDWGPFGIRTKGMDPKLVGDHLNYVERNTKFLSKVN